MIRKTIKEESKKYKNLERIDWDEVVFWRADDAFTRKLTISRKHRKKMVNWPNSFPRDNVKLFWE